MSADTIPNHAPPWWIRTLLPLALILLIAMVTWVAIMGLRRTGALESLELSFYDHVIRGVRPFERTPPTPLVVIGIQEEDINQHGWPISDQILTAALEKLMALQPAVVGVDLYRDKPRGEGGEALQKFLSTHKNVVGVMKFGGGNGHGILPNPALAGTDQVGFSDIPLDPQGVVRRGLLYMDDGQTFAQSFSLTLALRYLEPLGIRPGYGDNGHLRLGPTTIPPLEANDGAYQGMDASGYQFLLDFKGAVQRPPRFSLQELLSGAIPPREIQGKIVLLGVTAESVKDFFFTPLHIFQDGDLYYGVELHAQITGQILRMAREGGAMVGIWGNQAEGGWTLLWSLMGGLLALGTRNPWRVLGVSLLGELLLAGIALMGYHLDSLWIPWLLPALGFPMALGLSVSGLLYLREQPRASPGVRESDPMVRQAPLPAPTSLEASAAGEMDTMVPLVASTMARSAPPLAPPQQATAISSLSREPPLTSETVRAENDRQRLGRYEIVRELGRGAMGVVYEGFDPNIKRRVAIKVLSLSHDFEDDAVEMARERFFREAQSTGRLNHPHIVTIHDNGIEGDTAYIAMEFIEGRDLMGHTVKGKLLPVSWLVQIGQRIAQALDYAHENGVVHRDLKPANIMFNHKTSIIKLTDFGIARLTEGVGQRTRTGMLLGTPSYMSPEQISGQRVDGRSDIFSLGTTLYHLLTGERPFPGKALGQLFVQITQEPHPDALAIRPDLPPSLVAVLDKAMAKAPEERFQRCGAMAQSLAACYREMQASRQNTMTG